MKTFDRNMLADLNVFLTIVPRGRQMQGGRYGSAGRPEVARGVSLIA